MPERINEDAIAARRQQLFGDPWWRQRAPMRRSAAGRSGTPTDHCELCPAAADELCLKPCMEARKELTDGIEVTIP